MHWNFYMQIRLRGGKMRMKNKISEARKQKIIEEYSKALKTMTPLELQKEFDKLCRRLNPKRALWIPPDQRNKLDL